MKFPVLALVVSLGSAVAALSAAESVLTSAQALAPAENFPRFIVPGQEREMDALNAMHRLHYPPVWLDYPHRDPEAGLCTLWDEWLSGACLWADTAGILVCDGKVTITQRLKNSFNHKIIDAEGYVATHQHEGIGHILGWPFPYWIGSPGAAGVHFSAEGTKSAVLPRGAPVAKTAEGWTLAGAEDRGIHEDGWRLALSGAHASATAALGVIDPRVSPFLQLRWSVKISEPLNPRSSGRPRRSRDFHRSAGSVCRGQPVPRDPSRSRCCRSIATRSGRENHPAASELRQCGSGRRGRGAGAFFQYDTRHNINNFDYIRGAIDVFLWTGDRAFLRAELPRLRRALRFAQAEFHTRENNCVLTTWIGHEGTSGVVRHADGTKAILHGTGIGNNYWDLLPFGHKDSYATIRYYDTLVRMAALEREIARHPGWDFADGDDRFDPADLEAHAAAVKAEGNRIFWSEETGRFVAGPDATGARHDFGFTFLNTDAIHYGFATDAHARSILDWLDGKRIVAGDTSTGPDIYRFRFGPRSTTRRNVEYYFWGWPRPETIPFGGQVQDGGAVLGWSFMDLSSRLKVAGPDAAWKRLREITAWFDEVQAGGGYRAYYKKQGAALQGDGAAGGLGLDREFLNPCSCRRSCCGGSWVFRPARKAAASSPGCPEIFRRSPSTASASRAWCSP
jgi:hypothetical protein